MWDLGWSASLVELWFLIKILGLKHCGMLWSSCEHIWQYFLPGFFQHALRLLWKHCKRNTLCTRKALLGHFIDLVILGSQPLYRLTFSVLFILSINVWGKVIWKFIVFISTNISEFNSEVAGIKYILITILSRGEICSRYLNKSTSSMLHNGCANFLVWN